MFIAFEGSLRSLPFTFQSEFFQQFSLFTKDTQRSIALLSITKLMTYPSEGLKLSMWKKHLFDLCQQQLESLQAIKKYRDRYAMLTNPYIYCYGIYNKVNDLETRKCELKRLVSRLKTSPLEMKPILVFFLINLLKRKDMPNGLRELTLKYLLKLKEHISEKELLCLFSVLKKATIASSSSNSFLYEVLCSIEVFSSLQNKYINASIFPKLNLDKLLIQEVLLNNKSLEHKFKAISILIQWIKHIPSLQKGTNLNNLINAIKVIAVQAERFYKRSMAIGCITTIILSESIFTFSNKSFINRVFEFLLERNRQDIGGLLDQHGVAYEDLNKIIRAKDCQRILKKKHLMTCYFQLVDETLSYPNDLFAIFRIESICALVQKNRFSPKFAQSLVYPFLKECFGVIDVIRKKYANREIHPVDVTAGVEGLIIALMIEGKLKGLISFSMETIDNCINRSRKRAHKKPMFTFMKNLDKENLDTLLLLKEGLATRASVYLQRGMENAFKI